MERNFLKEQVMINILQYINDKDNQQINFDSIQENLRDVDLHNFFSNIEEIITEASKLAFKELVSYVTKESQESADKNLKIEVFFYRFIDFYLNNKGSMNLIWFDKVNLEDLIESRVEGLKLLKLLETILEEKYNETFAFEDVQKILHRVHCYCLGEILLFLSDRGMTSDLEEFKFYLINEITNLVNIYSTLEIKSTIINKSTITNLK